MPLAEHDKSCRSIDPVFFVSIHVPLAEQDDFAEITLPLVNRFNSRAPRGARLAAMRICVLVLAFQFTCPSRSTTPLRALCIDCHRVSIHVPLAEHDVFALDIHLIRAVSIHVPLAEHDFSSCKQDISRIVSIHVPLAEHDQLALAAGGKAPVSIHVPLAEHDQWTRPPL